MLFLLKLIFCIGLAINLAKTMNELMKRWASHPIIEEKERPFYIIKTYEDIKRGYENE